MKQIINEKMGKNQFKCDIIQWRALWWYREQVIAGIKRWVNSFLKKVNKIRKMVNCVASFFYFLVSVSVLITQNWFWFIVFKIFFQNLSFLWPFWKYIYDTCIFKTIIHSKKTILFNNSAYMWN